LSRASVIGNEYFEPGVRVLFQRKQRASGCPEAIHAPFPKFNERKSPRRKGYRIAKLPRNLKRSQARERPAADAKPRLLLDRFSTSVI